MKTIGFIGAYDKTDLIIYIARILTAMNKRVLVIDTTFYKRQNILSLQYLQQKLILRRMKILILQLDFMTITL